MSVCETCNETSPNPVSEVTINQTTISYADGEIVQHEWSNTGDDVTSSWVMDYELIKIDFVSIGGVVQSEDAYSIVGDTITFDDPPASGEVVLVRGLRVV
jgi:hypothetical protein